MIVVIAGSRSIKSYALIERVMCECPWVPTIIIAGGADGVDKNGERWALQHGYVMGTTLIVMRPFYGHFQEPRDAALNRNCRMADATEAGVVIRDPESPTAGCLHFKTQMERRGKPVYYVEHPACKGDPAPRNAPAGSRPLSDVEIVYGSPAPRSRA